MLQQLKDRYEKYEKAAKKAVDEAPKWAGVLGMGEDPRNHPCHMEFYEDVAAWVQAFLAAKPDADCAYAAAHWILTAAAGREGEPVFWFYYAAQGLARELIPLLTGSQCVALLQFYDGHYPRRDRMPVQKQVCQLLKKGSRRV